MASTSKGSENPTKKGILKHKGSVDHSSKEIVWDEMNIMATYHPADKDYGFMKVDEPPTPYSHATHSDCEDDQGSEEKPRKGSCSSMDAFDPAKLAERLEMSGQSSNDKPFFDDEEDDDEEEDDANLTEEERKRRRSFQMKRKMHYNEFAAVQMAKKLMAQEDDDDDEVEGAGPTQSQNNSAVPADAMTTDTDNDSTKDTMS